MKIGKVYANAEREEDQADRTLIEMGVIAGDGLLGAVIAAVSKLYEAGVDYSYYSESTPDGIVAGGKIELAWLELFVALKTIEKQSGKTWQAIKEARYAMVGGNLAGELVPPAAIERWLACIEEAL